MKFRREIFLGALLSMTGYLAIVQGKEAAVDVIVTATSLAVGVYFGYRIAEKSATP